MAKSVSDYLTRWDACWQTAKKMAMSRASTWPTPIAREGFELLRTALVYQRNALDALPSEKLHVLLRSDPGKLTTDDSVLDCPNPIFKNLPTPHYESAVMHLASTSFRLPVAVYKVCGASSPFTSVSPSMMKGDDWNRDVFSGYFAAVKGLEHCGLHTLSSTDDNAVRHSIVIALVHRDDFGHGEEGTGGAAFRQGREGVLNALYICRILEAQTALIGWSLRQLSHLSITTTGGDT